MIQYLCVYIYIEHNHCYYDKNKSEKGQDLETVVTDSRVDNAELVTSVELSNSLLLVVSTVIKLVGEPVTVKR